MLLRTILLLFLVTAFQNLSGQKVFIGGEEGARMLTWNDFKGMPDNSSPFFAFTAWNTKYKFSSVRFEGEKAILNGFEMTLEFDAKNSWKKKGKETDALLKHEQGHFDVGLLYLQEVLSTVASTSFSRTGFKEEIQKLIKGIHKKYVDMGDQYDKETDHSKEKDEQEKWNVFFGERVNR